MVVGQSDGFSHDPVGRILSAGTYPYFRDHVGLRWQFDLQLSVFRSHFKGAGNFCISQTAKINGIASLGKGQGEHSQGITGGPPGQFLNKNSCIGDRFTAHIPDLSLNALRAGRKQDGQEKKGDCDVLENFLTHAFFLYYNAKYSFAL